MGFRLVPNSVTLNDLERRNRPNGCVISPNSVAFWADCVKVVENTRILQVPTGLPKQNSLTFPDFSSQSHNISLTYIGTNQYRNCTVRTQ